MLRHGVTEWNNLYKIQGSSDIPLDENGISMAKQTGEYMKKNGITFDAVYSSPLDRAYTSAKLVCCSENIVKDERLKEMSFGKQEGLSLLEMKESGEDVPFKWFKNEPSRYDEQLAVYDPGAETFRAVIERAKDFMKDVIECHEAVLEDKKKRRILISGHGALDQALVFLMKKKENIDEFWKGGLLPNCGIDIIEYDRNTGKYSFAEEMAFYYETELFEKAPRLLK